LHIAELAVEGRQRGVMFFVSMSGERIRHHDDLEVEHHGVAGRAFAADIGRSAGDQERVDAAVAQVLLEDRGAMDESAVASLGDLRIFGLYVVEMLVSITISVDGMPRTAQF